MKSALGLKADMPFGKCCVIFMNVGSDGPDMLGFFLTCYGYPALVEVQGLNKDGEVA